MCVCVKFSLPNQIHTLILIHPHPQLNKSSCLRGSPLINERRGNDRILWMLIYWKEFVGFKLQRNPVGMEWDTIKRSD